MPEYKLPKKRRSFGDVKSIINASELSTGKLTPEDGQRSESIDRVPFSSIANEKFSFDIGSSIDTVSRAAGTPEQIISTSRPRNKKDRLKRAYFHYDRDDLLGALIDLMVEFTTVGFSLQVVSDDSNQDQAQSQEFIQSFQWKLEKICRQSSLRDLVETLVRDSFISDNMILYWRESEVNQLGYSSENSTPSESGEEGYTGTGISGIIDISSVKPSVAEWNNSFLSDILSVEIPDDIKKIIEEAKRLYGDRAESELINQGVDKKYIEAVNQGRSTVTLNREDGDNWIVWTKERKHGGLSDPSMFKIFLSLDQRNILNEGEFSTSLLMKHFIMLIKSGESIDNGPLAGNRANWLKDADAKVLSETFSNAAKTLRVICNHTTKVEFIFPPAEMFNKEKFQNVDRKLFNFAGVSVSIVDVEQGSHATAYISIKRMTVKMEKQRERISEMITKFFSSPSVRSRIGLPEGYNVVANFDSNALKEPRQLLEEVKFLFNGQVSDPRTAARELGRNPDSILSSKLRSQAEQEKFNAWDGVGGQTRSMSQKDQGGRPPREGTTLGDETRNQSAPARFTENS